MAEVLAAIAFSVLPVGLLFYTLFLAPPIWGDEFQAFLEMEASGDRDWH